MVFELIITPFFWILLYPILESKSWAMGRFGEALDHWLPLACLLSEYFLCSNMPFIRRHFKFIGLIAFVYLSVNFWYTINYAPVYPVMKWEGFIGFLVPIGTAIVAALVFLLLECISKKRLRKNGHNKIVDILEGQRHK